MTRTEKESGDALERLVAFWDAAAPSGGPRSAPGLTEDERAALAAELGLAALPPELGALYARLRPPPLADGGSLRGDAYRLLAPEELRTALDRVRRWSPAEEPFPFARAGADGYLCRAGAGVGDVPAGAVVEVEAGRSPPPVRFAGVERCLEVFAEGAAAGLLVADGNGALWPSDPLAWERFLEQVNPGFVNADPLDEPPRPEARAPSVLQKLSAGLSTLATVGLLVTVKVFRRQASRAGLGIFLMGLALAGTFLLVAHLVARRASAPAPTDRDDAIAEAVAPPEDESEEGEPAEDEGGPAG
ncbi:MAG: hypothetical protein D6731_15430 [Planctomycetota bacterium]|nr:MAG: hypothetical protein D6731_15430 [Planctomycetota bacterium]